MRAPLYKILLILASLALTACGAAGGAGGGSESAAANATESSYKDKLFAVPLNSTKYGSCAIVLKASSSSKFGMAFICYNGGNVFRYEMILGSYQTSGSNFTITATPDACSNYKTIFWDPSTPGNSATFKFSYDGKTFKLYDDTGVINFTELKSEDDSDFPYVATRGCFAKQNGTYSWINYTNAQAQDSVKQQLENYVSPAPTSGGGGSASVTPTAGCYDLSQLGTGSAASLTFQGQGWVSPYTGALQASVQAANVAFPGASYTRTNAAGDSAQVYVSGQNVIVYAQLSANTVSWIKYYGNTNGQASSVCGLYIDSPVSGSTLTMSIRMISGNGSAYSITL